MIAVEITEVHSEGSGSSSQISSFFFSDKASWSCAASSVIPDYRYTWHRKSYSQWEPGDGTIEFDGFALPSPTMPAPSAQISKQCTYCNLESLDFDCLGAASTSMCCHFYDLRSVGVITCPWRSYTWLVRLFILEPSPALGGTILSGLSS